MSRTIRSGVTLAEVLSFLDGIVVGLEATHPLPREQWDEHSKGVIGIVDTVADFMTNVDHDTIQFHDTRSDPGPDGVYGTDDDVPREAPGWPRTVRRGNGMAVGGLIREDDIRR